MKIILCFLALLMAYPAAIECKTHERPYYEEMQVHRLAFLHWLTAFGRADERVVRAVGCDDADSIPKVKEAGKIITSSFVPYHLMFNGTKIYKEENSEPWISDIIYGLHGHIDPQQEKVFHEVLKFIPPYAVMLEVGSGWAYYSAVFAKEIAHPTNYMIEPEFEKMLSGKINFALNRLKGNFFHGHCGQLTLTEKHYNSKPLEIDSFLAEHAIDHVHLLHANIMGAEAEMLKGASKSIQEKKIDYFFLSTYNEQTHAACLNQLKQAEYVVVTSYKPAESFSMAGLIVARRAYVPGPGTITVSKRK